MKVLHCNVGNMVKSKLSYLAKAGKFYAKIVTESQQSHL